MELIDSKKLSLNPVEKVEYRPYQDRVINNVLKAIEDGHKSILIISPTGSGKTIIAHEIARRLNEKYGWDYGWTCMRVGLLPQASRENINKFGLGYGKYFSVFDKNPPKCDVLIEDEAQHSASETSTTVVSKVDPKVYIAVTATPFRADRMKLCFSKIIHDAGLRQLVDEGWLSPYNQYIVDVPWTPQNVVDVYAREPDRWGKTVIFFLRKSDCYEAHHMLKLLGISSEVVVGGNVKDQDKKIQMFKEGKVQVLINVFVLTEGFDCPDLKTVFIRPGSKGPTIQMGGRAFRKHPSLDSKNIVQNTETKHFFTEIVSPLDKLVWDDNKFDWESRKSNMDELKKIRTNTMIAMSNSKQPVMPKIINRRKGRRYTSPRWNRDTGDITSTQLNELGDMS